MIRSLLCVENSSFEREIPEERLAPFLRQYFPSCSLNRVSNKQATSLDLQNNPVELVLTQDRFIEKWANTIGVDAILWKKLSDLGAKLDAYLQLQRYLEQYPLQLDQWVLREVIHNGQDAVIYRALFKRSLVGSMAEKESKTDKTGDSVSTIDDHTEDHVAIKRFKYRLESLSDASIKDFLGRIDAQCALNTPGLVRIIEGGLSGDVFYLVMEYMQHGTLRESLNSCGRPPLPHALAWFREIAEALECVHRAGLIHRDLKTGNIMLREDGSLALSDYGVSKRILLDSDFITENEIHCSPYYVSPEQVSGEACTQASDIYSLGIIFYELLTGNKPFYAEQPFELMMHHVMAPIPELPEELDRFQPVLNGLLAKDYHERYQSALDAIENLPLVA